MKAKLLTFIVAAMFLACRPAEHQPVTPPQDTTNVLPQDTIEVLPQDTEPILPFGDATLGAYMMIVKFANSKQAKHVILGHPIKDYNSDGYFEYLYDRGLSLNYLQGKEHLCSVRPEEIHFLTEHTNIFGSSPYIPLEDGYYLVDWKWQDLCPLSAITNYAATSSQMTEHLQNHIFMTDLRWKDLTDYMQNFDSTERIRPVELAEEWRTSFFELDYVFNDLKRSDPYLCYNKHLYDDGLSVDNAYLYYRYDGKSFCNPAGTYLRYLAYCDSMQDVYVQRLNTLIRNHQLEQHCFK